MGLVDRNSPVLGVIERFSLRWLIAALFTTIALLIVLRGRRWRREHPDRRLTARTGDALAATPLILSRSGMYLAYAALWVLGPLAWIATHVIIAKAFGWSREDHLTVVFALAMASSLVGVFIVALGYDWIRAAQTGSERLRRYVATWLLLIVVAALVSGVIMLFQRRA